MCLAVTSDPHDFAGSQAADGSVIQLIYAEAGELALSPENNRTRSGVRTSVRAASWRSSPQAGSSTSWTNWPRSSETPRPQPREF